MRYDLDLPSRNFVLRFQQAARLLRHHHDACRQLDDLPKNPALGSTWNRKHGVKRGDNRHPERPQQRQKMSTGFSPEYAELVLQRHGLIVPSIQKIRSVCVVLRDLGTDLKADRRWIVVVAIGIGHCHERSLQLWRGCAHCLQQVGSESGDTTSPRQRVSDERQALDRWLGRRVRRILFPDAGKRGSAAGYGGDLVWPLRDCHPYRRSVVTGSSIFIGQHPSMTSARGRPRGRITMRVAGKAFGAQAHIAPRRRLQRSRQGRRVIFWGSRPCSREPRPRASSPRTQDWSADSDAARIAAPRWNRKPLAVGNSECAARDGECGGSRCCR